MHTVHVKNTQGEWVAEERKSDINWLTGTVVILGSMVAAAALILYMVGAM